MMERTLLKTESLAAKEMLRQISKAWIMAKVPFEFTRVPRSLRHAANFTASEWQIITLFGWPCIAMEYWPDLPGNDEAVL